MFVVEEVLIFPRHRGPYRRRSCRRRRWICTTNLGSRTQPFLVVL